MSNAKIEFKINDAYINEEGKLLLTYDQIKKLPEFPQTRIIELLHGELYLPFTPNIQHQRLVKRLLLKIEAHVSEKNIGEVFISPVDVVLNKFNVVVPDIVFLSTERASQIQEKMIMGPPNLIIEVTSSNKSYDLERKKEIYERFQVEEYWVVIPEEKKVHQFVFNKLTKKYEEHVFESGNDVIESISLPGFSMALDEIFSE